MIHRIGHGYYCTFQVQELPLNRKSVNSKWVLKVKFRADGAYEKHKARLVAKGFLHRELEV